MSTIGDRIKLIRKENNLNQTTFGKKIGVNRDAISNIELDRNKNGVPDSIIKLIAITFNVNEEWLINGTEPMRNNTSENESLLKKLSNEYKLDDFQKRLVQKYLELTEQQKNAVKSFLDKIYEEEFANSQSSKNLLDEISITEEKEILPEHKNMSTDEITKQIASLENLLEKRQKEELSALKKQDENSEIKNKRNSKIS